MTKRFGGILVACALALVALTPAASAAPVVCGDNLFIPDAQGDQKYKINGNPTVASPAQTDTLGLFFSVEGGKVAANIVVDDLVLTPPQGFQAVRYRTYWTMDDVEHYVQALVTADGVTYTWGQDYNVPGYGAFSYQKSGDTTGAVFEGKNGVVQIALPAEKGGTPGTQLNAVGASLGLLTFAGTPEQAQSAGTYTATDTAPDDLDTSPNTTPVSCAPAPAPDGGTTPPGTTPEAPAPQAPAASELRLSLATTKLSAKRANKARSASLRLRSSERVTDLTVTLKKGSKALGTGRLAQLASSGRAKLKLKRKLKKGAHTVLVTGKRADGSAFSVPLKLRVTA